MKGIPISNGPSQRFASLSDRLSSGTKEVVGNFRVDGKLVALLACGSFTASSAWERLASQLSKVGEPDLCRLGFDGSNNDATAARQEAVLGLSSARTAVSGRAGKSSMTSFLRGEASRRLGGAEAL